MLQSASEAVSYGLRVSCSVGPGTPPVDLSSVENASLPRRKRKCFGYSGRTHRASGGSAIQSFHRRPLSIDAICATARMARMPGGVST